MNGTLPIKFALPSASRDGSVVEFEAGLAEVAGRDAPVVATWGGIEYRALDNCLWSRRCGRDGNPTSIDALIETGLQAAKIAYDAARNVHDARHDPEAVRTWFSGVRAIDGEFWERSCGPMVVLTARSDGPLRAFVVDVTRAKAPHVQQMGVMSALDADGALAGMGEEWDLRIEDALPVVHSREGWSVPELQDLYDRISIRSLSTEVRWRLRERSLLSQPRETLSAHLDLIGLVRSRASAPELMAGAQRMMDRLPPSFGESKARIMRAGLWAMNEALHAQAEELNGLRI